jgi:hypothetical protein
MVEAHARGREKSNDKRTTGNRLIHVITNCSHDELTGGHENYLLKMVTPVT